MVALRNFSASQINAFSDCQRLWLLNSVLKMRGPTTPAQQRGIDIHGIVEHYLRTGEIRADWPGVKPDMLERNLKFGYVRYVEWMVKHLPRHDEEHLYVELQMFLDTPTGKVISGYNDVLGPDHIPLVGYADIALFGREIPEIGDLKSTTNLRYAKTPAELNQDTQMNTYARWVFERQSSLDEVKAWHIYCKVESGKPAPKTVRSTKIVVVPTVITRQGNADVWGGMTEKMSAMIALAANDFTIDDLNEVKPNVNHCPAYGGCDHRELCGISVRDTISIGKPTKEGEAGMSFLDKIKKAKEANATNAGEAPAEEPKAEVKAAPKAKPKPKPVAKKEEAKPQAKFSFRDRLKNKPVTVVEDVTTTAEADAAEEPAEAKAVAEATAVLSPDAPPRTTTEERGAELRATAEEKAEKKKAAKKKPAAKRSKHKRELTLYFGCTPQKGEHQANFVLMEDFMAPILTVLNAEVAEKSQGKMVNYRELAYADEKMALANTVQAYLDDEETKLPSAIAILGGGTGGEIATLLIPKATDVVRISK